MALLSASDFTGYSDSYAAPAGFNDPIFAGSVDLILSTGITQQAFDTLSTALKCTHYMEANNLYSLSPNEDVTILNLRSKLLILENTYINQKMMNSYVFTYHGASVRAIHRSMSDTVTLTDALSSVGFRCVGLPWSTACNSKMETDRADKDRPRIQVVDVYYKSPTLPHTNLLDSAPIVISNV
uniref:hypothetical protein n=1 Tax=Flavobacterium sp. TaxID=239 RepID=UPI0040499747